MRIFYALIPWTWIFLLQNIIFLCQVLEFTMCMLLLFFLHTSPLHIPSFFFWSIYFYILNRQFVFLFYSMYIICMCNPVSIRLSSIYFPIAPPLWILSSHICWHMQHELILGKNGGVLWYSCKIMMVKILILIKFCRLCRKINQSLCDHIKISIRTRHRILRKRSNSMKILQINWSARATFWTSLHPHLIRFVLVCSLILLWLQDSFLYFIFFNFHVISQTGSLLVCFYFFTLIISSVS